MSLLILYSSRGASELAVIKSRQACFLLRKAARASFPHWKIFYKVPVELYAFGSKHHAAITKKHKEKRN